MRGEARAYSGRIPGALRNQRFCERQGGISHFVLHRRVAIQCLVAGGVGLPKPM
jgi:hypothetical protein